MYIIYILYFILHVPYENNNSKWHIFRSHAIPIPASRPSCLHHSFSRILLLALDKSDFYK